MAPYIYYAILYSFLQEVNKETVSGNSSKF